MILKNNFYLSLIREGIPHPITFFPNIDNLKNSYFKIAKEMQIDGLIFNQAFGCPAISNIYDNLKEEIKDYLSIPAVGITFRKIGDNVEEVKNRLKPFMDMFNQ